MFTPVRDLNLKILSELNDKELGRMCQTNQYAKELCRNEDFWRNRTLKKFRPIFTDRELFDLFKTFNKSWRNFYIILIDVAEKLSENLNMNLYGAINNYKIKISNYMSQKSWEIADKLLKKQMDIKELKDIDFISPSALIENVRYEDKDLAALLFLYYADDKRIYISSIGVGLLRLILDTTKGESGKEYIEELVGKLSEGRRRSLFEEICRVVAHYYDDYDPSYILEKLSENMSWEELLELYVYLSIRYSLKKELNFYIYNLALQKGATLQDIQDFIYNVNLRRLDEEEVPQYAALKDEFKDFGG